MGGLGRRATERITNLEGRWLATVDRYRCIGRSDRKSRLLIQTWSVSRKAVLGIAESAVLFEKYTKRKMDGIMELRGRCEQAGMALKSR